MYNYVSFICIYDTYKERKERRKGRKKEGRKEGRFSLS
jgi:hypothetical protein